MWYECQLVLLRARSSFFRSRRRSYRNRDNFLLTAVVIRIAQCHILCHPLPLSLLIAVEVNSRINLCLRGIIALVEHKSLCCCLAFVRDRQLMKLRRQRTWRRRKQYTCHKQQALSAFSVHVFSLTKFYQHHPFSSNSRRIGKLLGLLYSSPMLFCFLVELLSAILSRAELKDDSGSIAEVILPIACAVREFRQEVFRLNRANREVSRDLIVESSAHGHREGVQGRVIDTSRSSQQNLRKRRHLSVTAKINPRPGHVGENSGMESIAGVIAAEVSYDPEPAVGIVSELSAAAVKVVRVTKVAHSHIVVAPVHFCFRRFILRFRRHSDYDDPQQSSENVDKREGDKFLQPEMKSFHVSVFRCVATLAHAHGDFVSKM